MTFTEVMQLKSAGFTPDQITTLATSDAIPSAPEDSGVDLADAPSTPVVESPAEVGEGNNAPSPTEPGTNQASGIDSLAEIRELINGMREDNKQLRELIQGNNIRDKTMEIPKEPDAAAVMSEIIRPSIRERG